MWGINGNGRYSREKATADSFRMRRDLSMTRRSLDSCRVLRRWPSVTSGYTCL